MDFQFFDRNRGPDSVFTFLKAENSVITLKEMTTVVNTYVPISVSIIC